MLGLSIIICIILIVLSARTKQGMCVLCVDFRAIIDVCTYSFQIVHDCVVSGSCSRRTVCSDVDSNGIPCITNGRYVSHNVCIER